MFVPRRSAHRVGRGSDGLCARRKHVPHSDSPGECAGAKSFRPDRTENTRSVSWAESGDDLWRFGGEIYVGYADGSTHYQDAFGRTSDAHKYLQRKNRQSDLGPNDSCGCGSGRKFKHCCKVLPEADRPSWDVYGIRERNLMLTRAVQDILGLTAGKSWDDVRRELSDEQVKRIHEAFGSLWPEDTDLTELLP